MKIALIRPPATYADWYQNPILGISYICACLEQKGFDCRIFDAYFHRWSEGQLLQKVKEYEPDIIGITAMTHEIVEAAQIASQLKKQLKTAVVIGGCHVTALPQQTLAEFPVFDYGVYGEGEQTFLEMLESFRLNAEPNPAAVKGLVFRRDGQIIVNEPQPFLTSAALEALPYPAFHQYYGKDTQALSGRNSCYTMLTSRGCPYNCAFCMQVLGRKVRRRSAESICEEIEFAISAYGVHTLDFSDEIFLLDSQETRDLLKLIIKRGLPKKIRWMGQVRANFANKELIALAKEAGCYRLGMGVESGDEEILKIIDKGITIEQIKQAARVIKDAGISLGTYFILGHPNETRQTLRKTVNLAAELNTNTIAVGLMVPYPGTRVFDMAQKGQGGYRLLTKDWSQYDKYCGKVLEGTVPYKELVKWQKRALIGLYLKNFRFIDAFRYFWERRRAFKFVFSKWIKLRLAPKI